MISLALVALSFVGTLAAQATFPTDLAFKQLDGSASEAVDFSRTEGPTIVAFWATWCAPCKQELDAYAKTYAAWRDAYGVEVYAVSVDQARAQAKVPGMVAEKGWPFPVLLDAEQTIMERLGLMSIPQMYIVDAAGNIAYEHAGFEPEDLAKVEAELARLSRG